MNCDFFLHDEGLGFSLVVGARKFTDDMFIGRKLHITRVDNIIVGEPEAFNMDETIYLSSGSIKRAIRGDTLPNTLIRDLHICSKCFRVYINVMGECMYCNCRKFLSDFKKGNLEFNIRNLEIGAEYGNSCRV